MGRLEGQCAKINVWREVKIDGGEARQISCFSEVETVLIKRTHISLSGHVSAPSDKKAQGIIHGLLLGRGFGIVLSCPIFAPQTVKSFGTIYTMCFLLLTCKVFGFQWAWWMLITTSLQTLTCHFSQFPLSTSLSPVHTWSKAPCVIVCNNNQACAFVLGYIQGEAIKHWPEVRKYCTCSLVIHNSWCVCMCVWVRVYVCVRDGFRVCPHVQVCMCCDRMRKAGPDGSSCGSGGLDKD